VNRLLFADELVLHVWFFSTGSSARIYQLSAACDQAGTKIISKISGSAVSLFKAPKAMFSASERKYTAAGGVVQVHWSGIYE